MAENGLFGAPFLTPRIPPKKLMWVPFLRPFPENEAHHFYFFPGAQNGVFWVGAKKFLLKKLMCEPINPRDPPVLKILRRVNFGYPAQVRIGDPNTTEKA